LKRFLARQNHGKQQALLPIVKKPNVKFLVQKIYLVAVARFLGCKKVRLDSLQGLDCVISH